VQQLLGLRAAAAGSSGAGWQLRRLRSSIWRRPTSSGSLGPAGAAAWTGRRLGRGLRTRCRALNLATALPPWPSNMENRAVLLLRSSSNSEMWASSCPGGTEEAPRSHPPRPWQSSPHPCEAGRRSSCSRAPWTRASPASRPGRRPVPRCTPRQSPATCTTRQLVRLPGGLLHWKTLLLMGFTFSVTGALKYCPIAAR
jgi:hypothetical protein